MLISLKFRIMMFATQVLPEDVSENEEEDDGVQIVGFLLVGDDRYEIAKGETKIGRDPTLCSVVIENFTISKVHAVVESDGIDDTFIYDNDSTNQTKLGKKVLKPHCRYKLENNSKLTFGNINAQYILPHKSGSDSDAKSNSKNFNEADDFDDIFEIATQVSAPEPNSKIVQFEKISENVPIFKMPNDVSSEKKSKESPGSSKESAEVKEHHSKSPNLVPKTEFYNNSFDSSGIFSLSTQCQINSPLSVKTKHEEKVSVGGSRNSDSEKIKSLLNDGQDDVLCTFMSLNSPSERTSVELPDKIKTEIVENPSQLFDLETQVQAVVTSSREENIKKIVHIAKDSSSYNFSKPSISSTPLNKLKSESCNFLSEKNNDDTDSAEEDFIKTQEFKFNQEADGSSSITKTTADNLSVESNMKCYFEETTEFSAMQQTSDEDFVCTQKFEVENLDPDKTTDKIPENNESNVSGEDLIETQVYDVKKELSKVVPENEEYGDIRDDFLETQIFDIETEKTVSESEKKEVESTSFQVPESPQNDTPEDVDDFTQRNMEDDFICTQAFNASNKNDNVDDSKSPERNDDDDFIATQLVDVPVNDTIKSKHLEESISNVQTVSRESSPDMLDSDFSTRISEDLIQTPVFDNSKCKNSTPLLSEFSEKIGLMFSDKIKKESNDYCNFIPTKNTAIEESSGDETESDLEIIFDKSDITAKDLKIVETSEKSFKHESQQSDNNTIHKNVGHDDDNSNASYVFQLDAENEIETNINRQTAAGDSDSDATDCEEIAVVCHNIKKEPPNDIKFEDTQVLTLTPPNDFAQASNVFLNGEESPEFQIGNNEDFEEPLLEIPHPPDATNRLPRNKHDPVAQKQYEDYQTPSKMKKTDEVGIETYNGRRKIESPLKRPVASCSDKEIIPVKKSKTETSDRKLRSGDKQFLKLWQAHDIDQIQPNRTRNSLKNLSKDTKSTENIPTGNNNSNELANSYRKTNTGRKSTRKQNYDITSYLCKKTDKNKRTSPEVSVSCQSKQETSPKFITSNNRVLRSCRNGKDGSFEPSENNITPTAKRPRRNSRFKNGDYFNTSCVNVVFTGFDSDSLEKIVTGLGGKKTNDLSTGDVVVAEKVRRTVKFLCAIGLSLPIASPDWLMSCKAEKKFLNPWKFLLKDEDSEKKWDFELKSSLEKSMKMKLMEGLNVFATENAKPPVKDLLVIVECCGGTPLFDPPTTWPKKTVIVSCEEDQKYWPMSNVRNIKIVHYEFILSGVLKQKLDYKTYKLR